MNVLSTAIKAGNFDNPELRKLYLTRAEASTFLSELKRRKLVSEGQAKTIRMFKRCSLNLPHSVTVTVSW